MMPTPISAVKHMPAAMDELLAIIAVRRFSLPDAGGQQ
jgi:hypothetical protein